jgi:transcriptional regulator with XRE-family HTH domain
MRGVHVNAALFQRLRRARGLTQRELAKLAGVGERTVRNAESGRRVRLEFLRYLAIALQAEAMELVDDADELRAALAAQSRVDNLLTALDAIGRELDMSELVSLADINVLVRCPGPSQVPFCGEYRGPDGILRLGEINQQQLAFERPPEIQEIRTSGNFVILSGRDWSRAIPTGKSFSTWWYHIYEFSEGRLVRFDNIGDMSALTEAYTAGDR